MNTIRRPGVTMTRVVRAQIATARGKQQADIARLRKRRKQLVKVAKRAADPAVEKLAQAKLSDLDEVIRRLTRELRHMTKRSLNKAINRLEVGAPISNQSGNLPKVTWAKPYRG